MTKQCSKCKEHKDASAFSPDKRNASGLQSQCRECQYAHARANKERIAARAKTYRTENAEQIRERTIKRYHQDLETSRARSRENARRRREQGKVDKARKNANHRANYARNPDKFRAVALERRKANLEQRLAIQARYRERNRAALREKHAQYNAANRHITKAAKARRRGLERNAGAAFTAAEWRAICVYHGHRCLCCGETEPTIKLTPDHVVPLVSGGANTIDNIQPLCLTCNLRKGTKTIDYRAPGTVYRQGQLALETQP